MTQPDMMMQGMGKGVPYPQTPLLPPGVQWAPMQPLPAPMPTYPATANESYASHACSNDAVHASLYAYDAIGGQKGGAPMGPTVHGMQTVPVMAPCPQLQPPQLLAADAKL